MTLTADEETELRRLVAWIPRGEYDSGTWYINAKTLMWGIVERADAEARRAQAGPIAEKT